ncbi:DUF4167 domain-containing protein [Roseibaca sp. Y0-43]|uniref:DUF4167 domain-containing protein n=1 Tax=Roseibaca sp. Y0-43 TaxID=2816854 RepID=UPI001D0C3BDB|nr:DUF4167 domain-containing protein [Roseibaca sp. Y0-43]MCC1481518.1 DUF4167 domain-containing protein [Roseibaca sp. Y0-43]
MRSPSKRSRSKSNRPKTLGNIVNRVFDSSGPEGKVRGTPQQIIEKYQILARDAQLANDRVSAENFQQHAEHYTRMLAQAQREQAAEQEARRQQQEEQRARHDDRSRQNNGNNGNNGQNGHQRQPDPSEQTRTDAEPSGGAFDVADNARDQDSGLVVDTPENKAPADAADAKPRNSRKPRAPKAEGEGGDSAKPRRAPRKPRAPRTEGDTAAPAPELKSSAAE